MKMKLPITDQFLWMIYNFFETTGEILEPPEIFKIQSFASAFADPEEKKMWRRIERKRNRKQFSQFINYLKKQGYIKISSLKMKKGMLLTLKGKQKALRVKSNLLNKKKRKDGRWIMIMYDIPEKRKKERKSFRELLFALGYQQFQKSILVCPYDVFKETEEIIRSYKIDFYVKIFLIEEISL